MPFLSEINQESELVIWFSPDGHHMRVEINYIRGSQSMTGNLVPFIIHAVIWQHLYFSFGHKLVIWYWINNSPFEYKPDISLKAANAPNPGTWGRFFEESGLGQLVASTLIKWFLDQRDFISPCIVPPVFL